MINRCNMSSGCINPTYLVIFKGDDTDFPGNQEIDIIIDTEMDLSGIKAHFRFMDFTQDFNEIPEDKKLKIVIPHEKTSSFPVGASDATLFLEDQSGKIRTVSNRIHVVVTNSVHEAYYNNDAQAITVSVTGVVTWDMIEGKPDIPEASDDDPLMDGEASSGSSESFSRGDHRHPSDTSKRDTTDFGVKGEPQGVGSWFTVNGRQYNYEAGVWNNQYDSSFISRPGETYRYEDVDQEIDFVFTLDNGVYTGDGYVIIGYVDTLAQVSQIPTSTSQLTNNGAPNGEGSPYASESYVNTSVATNTANFLGTFGYVTDLHFNPPASSSEVSNSAIATALLTAVSSPSNNDYVFVKIDYTATTPEDEFRRFKFDSLNSVWRYEYTLNSASFTPEQWAAINSGATAAKVTTWDGYAALIAQKAALSDLPYRLVEPGEWNIVPSMYNGASVSLEFGDDGAGTNEWIFTYTTIDGYLTDVLTSNTDENALSVSAEVAEGGVTTVFTATRPSLPGHLLDRAGNRVVVTGATTLTLPEAVPGHIRDFLVRLEISGSTVPTITFAAPTGETLTYETDGDDFPVPDEAGTWSYSFTENCVAHKFAVSLKKVNTVAQGGS